MKILVVLIVLGLVGCGGGSSTPTPAPTTTLTATAQLNGTTELTWNSTNATSCALSGSATATLAPSGTTTVAAPITSDQSYTLACTGAGGNRTTQAIATPPTSFPTTTQQTHTATQAFWIGDYVVHNDSGNPASWTNPYAPWSLAIQPQSQSATVASDGSIDVITSWDFPITNGIKDAPGLQYGKTQPVAGFGQSTVAGYPVVASNVTPPFAITYTDTITGVSSGSAYDLLFDNYFSDTTDLAKQTLEMSINQICVLSCYDTYIDTVTFNGVTYQVAWHPVAVDANGNPAAPHLVFSSTSAPQISGTVTLKPFIDYAIAHGYLNPNDYFGNVAVQNEVYAGKATSELTVKFSN